MKGFAGHKLSGKLLSLLLILLWTLMPHELNASPPPNLPLIPQNLQKKIGPRRIELTWSKNTDSTHFYNIYRKTGAGSFALIDTSFDGRYTDTNAQAGVQYDYSLEAIDSIGQSSGLTASIFGKSNRIWYVAKNGLDNLLNGFSTRPFASVGYALQRFQNGDTVIIAEGRYVESIDIRGKGFVLASEFLLDGDTTHISRTMLDGNRQNRVLRVGASTGNKVYIEGLTIQNGLVPGDGGGIYGEGEIHISDCRFLKNFADAGGAVFINSVRNVHFNRNTFEFNRASRGSSLYLFPEDDQRIFINNCRFSRDTASNSVILCYGEWRNNTLFELKNNLIAKNHGIGLIVQGGTVNVVNTTIADNIYNGSPILFYAPGNLNVYNSLFHNNGKYLPIDTTTYQFVRTSGRYPKLKLRNSLFDTGSYNDSGVIIGNPRFVKTNRDPSKSSDYALLNYSPAIGGGSASFSSGFDILGNARSQPSSSSPDMGAIESQFAIPAPIIEKLAGGAQKTTLNWSQTKFKKLKQYKIYRSTQPIADNASSGVVVDTISAFRTSYTDSGLTNLTRYYYRMKSIDSNGVESGLGNELFAKPNTPPVKLDSLLVQGGPRLNYLNWKASNTVNARYKILRGSSSSNLAVIRDTTSSLHFTDTGLVAWNSYYYAIKVIDTVGVIGPISDVKKGVPNNVWWIDTGKSVVKVGVKLNPIKGINSTVKKAVAGDTLILLNGIYSEAITINKTLVISSNHLFSKDSLDTKNTILDGKGIATLIYLSNSQVKLDLRSFTIKNSDGVALSVETQQKSTIYGLRFIDNQCPSNVSQIVTNGPITIDSCYFNGNESWILVAAWGGSSVVGYPAIKRCFLINNGKKNFTNNILQYAHRGIISNNILINNTGSACIFSGCNSNLDTFIVENNTIVNNDARAILIDNCFGGVYAKIYNNYIEKNKFEAIYLNDYQGYSVVNIHNNYLKPGKIGSNSFGAFNVIYSKNDTTTSSSVLNNSNPTSISDLSLIPSSKLFGIGLSSLKHNTDIIGQIRPIPLGTTPDIGAVESKFGFTSPLITSLDGAQNSIIVNWSQIPFKGRAKFKIYRSTSPFTDTNTVGLVVDTISGYRTNYKDSGLTNLTRYYYRMKSVDSSGTESGYGEQVSAIPNSLTDAPDSINIENGPRGIRLSWKPFKQSSFKYRLYRGTNLNNAQIIADTLKQSHYVDKGLNTWQNYYYYVRVIDSVNVVGKFSNAIIGVPNNIWWVSKSGSNSNLGTENYPLMNLDTAFNRSVNADTFILHEGKYFVSLDMRNKGFTLASKYLIDGDTTHISRTMLDGNRQNRVLQVGAGGSIPIRVQGITIQHGYVAGEGSGLKLQENGKLHVEHCLFLSNKATGDVNGAAIYFYGSGSISNTDFRDNKAGKGSCLLAMPYLDSIIDISYCNFIRDTANEGSVMLKFGNGIVIFRNCLVSHNVGNIFNLQTQFGRVQLTNTTIADNKTLESPIIIKYGKLTITNSIFFNNGNIVPIDTLTWSNYRKSNTGLSINLKLRNSLFDTGSYNDSGVIIGNPRFVKTNRDPSKSSDYALLNYSPAIGGGSASFSSGFDILGNARSQPSSSSPDMGAVENQFAFPAPTIQNLAGGEQKITLRWSQTKFKKLKQYKIYRSTQPIADNASSGVVVDTISAFRTSYTDSGLTNLTRYYYRMKSIDSNGVESGLGNELFAKPNTPPVKLDSLLVQGGPRLNYLNWKASNTVNARYKILRGSSSSNLAVIRDTTSSLHFTDTGLVAWNSYYYAIKVIDTVGVIGPISDVKKGVPNNVWWVSKTGLNSNSGTENNPLLNIDTAFKKSLNADTFILHEGRYFVSLDMRNKGFTLASKYLIDGDTTHISRTMLDGSKQNRVLYVGAAAGKPVFLNGVTIQHGKESVGAGVRFEGSNLRIKRCLFLSNKASGDVNGAGIYFGGAGSIINTDFRDHHARKGSALMMGPTPDSTVIIDGCNFIRDTATECGSVMIYMGSGKVILKNSLVSENFGNSFWIQSSGADLQLVNTTVADNQNNGSTILGWIGKLSVENSIFYNNGNYLPIDTTQFASFRRDNPPYKFGLRIRNSIFDKGNYKDSGVIIGNPLFVKSSRNASVASDYALSNSSPVLGRGLIKYSAGYDLLGKTRIQPAGSASDYGAIENSLQNYLDSFHARGGYKRSVLTWSLLPNNRNDLKIIVFKDSISGLGVFKPVDTLGVTERFVDSLLGGKKTNTYYIKIVDNSGNLVQSSDTQTVNTTPNLYVSNSGRNDNPGSLKYPLKTITYALTKAQKRDTVFVLAGTYSDNLNIYIDSVTILGVDGFNSTFVQAADNNQQLVHLPNVRVRGLKIQGITFGNSRHCVQTSGVQGNSGSFENCRFTKNGYSGAATFQYGKGAFKFLNCLFDRNKGGFIFTNNDTTNGGSYFNYCTFVNNASFSNSFTTGSNNAKVAILNSILWDTRKDSVDGLSVGNPYLYIENSLVKDAVRSFSNSNFNYEPVFTDTTLLYISNKSLANNYGIDSIYLGYGDYIRNIGFDITGKQRPIPTNTKPDIGSYENGHGSKIIDNLTVTAGFRRVMLGVDLLDSTELLQGRLTIRAYIYDSTQKKSVFVDSINQNKLPSAWVLKNIKSDSRTGFYIEVVDDLGYKIEYSDTLYTVADSTVYLSPNGTDVSLGTKNSPLLTINTAIQDAGPRDTIYLLAGHYNQSFETKAYIQVIGVEGYQKTSISTNSNTDACVNLRGPGSVVEGLTIKNSRYGVVCHNFTHARMNNCRITKCGKINEWSFAIRGHDGTGLFTNLIVDSNLNNAVSFDYKHSYGYRFYNCNIINNESFGATNTNGPGKLWFVNSILWVDAKDSIEANWNSGYKIINSSVKSNYQSALGSNIYVPPTYNIYPKLSDTSRLLGIGIDSILENNVMISVKVPKDIFNNGRPNPFNSRSDLGVYESPFSCAIPVVQFKVNDSIQCYQNHKFKFTNTSKHFAKSISYYWDFGDSSTSTARNPIKVYNSWGMNKVKLIGLDNRGCRDTFIHQIRIAPEPTSIFTINDSVQCENDNLFVFEDISTVLSGGGSLSSAWVLGDGGTKTGDSISYNYKTKTSYIRVMHKSISSYGCRDSSTQIVNVLKGPDAKFNIDTVLYCIRGNEFGFTDATVAGVGTKDRYVWTWGDTQKDTYTNAARKTHSYMDTGLYSIQLWVRDDKGCYDSISKSTRIHPNPTAKFSQTDSAQCLDANSFTFTQQSKSGSPNTTLTYAWNFADTNSTAASPTIKYKNAGSRNISLIAANAFGCKDTVASKLRVYALPNPSFAINDSTQCENDHQFVFTNGSNIGAGEGSLSYAWNLGDGTSSVQTNVTQGYVGFDTLTVKLVVSSSFGCKDSLSKRIEILQKPQTQLVRLFTDSCLDSKVKLKVIDREVRKPHSVSWLYSNGFSSTDSLSVTSYATEGAKSARVIVGNARGCLDTLNYNFNLYNNPIAGFYAVDSAICFRGNEFEWKDSSDLQYGTAIKYVWHFGDGNNDTSSINNSIKHQYADTGMYEVQLQITNILGCADTANRKVRVDYHPVTKITKINSDSCLNNASFFKVDDLRAAKIPNILWTFSDASTFTDSSITKKFTTNGAQRVETIISNIFGCADTAELNFNLYKNPAASYTVADTFDCLQGNKFDFQSTSTNTYGSLNAYNWNFGNSSAAGSGSSTSYQYLDSGTYSVRLIVINTLGCADSVRRLMRVNPNPRVYFNADIYLQCLNTNSTKFTDSSESNMANATLQYAWDFGDTTTSAVANPSKVYAYYGVKSVTAIVTNAESCADTVTRNIEIKPEPIARLSIADAAQCENNNLFTFIDTTVMPARGGTHWVRWLVDEKEIGDSITIQNYTIDSAKTYTLKMISNSEFGCQDSIEKLFRVLPKPQASIRYTSPDSCLSTTAGFTAINSAGNGIKNANWLFSDGTRATGESTNKKYSTAGSKWIDLILENTNGCFDTTRFEFNIHKNPIANFIAGNYSQCLVGNSFTFFDSSKAVAGSLDSIRWNFADGTIQKAIAGSKPKYTFQTARSYRIRLIAYNSFACQDSTERTVIVKATPEADFDINNNSQCLNTNAFDLTNKSQPNNGNASMSYTWSFGDSSTSSSRNLTKKFQYDGSKTIRLISSNSDGCIDTIQKSVTVRSMPKADFTINTVSQCVNQNTYSYSDVSTIKSGGGTLSRIWNLGDGSVSNQKNISNKTYASAQNFNIQLIARNNFACADTLIKVIQVLPKPNVNFTVNQDTQCLVSNNYTFNNQSSIVTGGGTLSYQWSYGEGSTSTNTHPSHSFKNFGTYQIKLRAQSQFGCVDSLKRPVKVVANPLVDFSFVNSNKQCNSVDTFSLANKTDKRNAFAVSYLWHFGDGTSSTQTNFKKSYQRSGDYRITLYAENKNGCKDSVSYNSKVYPDPVADFAINQAGQCINNQKFDFTNNTSVAFGGGSLSYQWLYSDTLFATSTQSTKSFNRVKTYGIKLIASSSLGCKDSILRNIVVYPKPIAKFDINDTTQCLNNNIFKLTNNSQVSSGTNSYQWNFGDVTGNSVVSPDKTYSKFGTYSIKLLALSNNACRDSITKKVTVHSQPMVRFSRSDTALCRYQNSFTFTNNSTNADASKLSYRWNYSDGTTDNVTNPKVGFKESGLYLIKLVGRSDFGCADSQIQSVRVFPQPTPSFTIKTANQCLTNNSYEATNYSTIASEGGTLSYRWEFGNASNSTLTNPTWKYASDDTFKVRMYVESSLGCKDSLFKSVIVYPQPLVSFTVNKTSQCLGTNSFNLNNASSVTYGSLKYDWTFGDGGRSVGISPLVKYNTDGKYRVGLYAATNFGCKDSAFVNVTVHPDPQALFSVNDESQCLRGNEFALKNNTTLSAGTFNSAWDFGDAKGSNNKDPKHGYTDDGIYIIRLKVTSAESCMDSTYKIIQVYPQPSASYTINDSVQCINDNDFIFENKSRVNFGGLRSFWDFGDVSYSSDGTGRHTYSKTGTFNVRLVSFTAFACSDTVNQKVRITEIPQIAFTLDTAMLCERGNIFDATNKSTYKGIEVIDYQWKSSDGFTVNALNYTHSYTERGNYKLKLVGRSSQGCMDSSTQNLKVFPQGESKVVVFDSLQCLFGNDFTFGNESKVDGAAFSLMSWNFGGVFIDTQFRVTPNQFQFGDTGTYRVTLITTTENLCMDTSAVSIRVVPMPVAKLKNGTLSYCHNEQGFEYLDISQKEPGYSNKWLFNKQVVSNTDTLQPTFILPGKYGIRMVVYTEFGCSDTISTVAISNAVPKAKIGVNNNEQCLETNEFTFSNVSTQFTKPTAFWDLGDGTLGSGNSIKQNYSDAGEYVVTLVVENDSQCSDTARINVFVNPTPEASLDIEPTCLNIPIILASNSGIQFGKIVSYLWNMGDGTNYSDSLPAHEYRKSGKNNISLAMRSNKGCYAIFYDSIDVFPNPEAAFSLLTERPTILQNNVGFLDSSTNAATLEWDFGDGSDPVYDEFEWYHTYSDTGNYRVQLAVVSFDGCTDTSSRVIRIWPDFNILLPTAFSPNADGINDIYHIRGNHHAITTAIWQVYTEDGIKVFESNDIEGGWNGQLMNNGKPLPMGNYQLNLVVKDMYGNQSQLNEKIAIIR